MSRYTDIMVQSISSVPMYADTINLFKGKRYWGELSFQTWSTLQILVSAGQHVTWSTTTTIISHPDILMTSVTFVQIHTHNLGRRFEVCMWPTAAVKVRSGSSVGIPHEVFKCFFYSFEGCTLSLNLWHADYTASVIVTDSTKVDNWIWLDKVRPNKALEPAILNDEGKIAPVITLHLVKYGGNTTSCSYHACSCNFANMNARCAGYL